MGVFLLLYTVFVAFGLAFWTLLLLRNPRLGIIVGVLVSTAASGALPWNIFPVSGVATAVQMLLLYSALLVVLQSRKVTRLAKQISPYAILLATIASVLLIWTLLSNNPEYGLSKSFLFFLKSVVPVILLGLLGPWRIAEARASVVALSWAGITLSLRLLAHDGLELERAGFDNLYSIEAARIAGVGATIALVVFMTARFRPSIHVVNLLIVLLVCAIGLALTGSRGPVLATIVTSVFFSFIFLRRMTWLRVWSRTLILLLMLVPVMTVILNASDVQSLPSVARMFDRFMTIGENQSDEGRIDRYRVAIQEFLESRGVGIGTGGFASAYGNSMQGEHGRDYPHNILLEAAVELGVIGLIAVSIVIILGVVMACRIAIRTDNGYMVALCALSVYGVFNALISYDIAGNGQMWLFLALPCFVFWSSRQMRGSHRSETPRVPMEGTATADVQ